MYADAQQLVNSGCRIGRMLYFLLALLVEIVQGFAPFSKMKQL